MGAMGCDGGQWSIIITALMKHYRNTAPLRQKEEKGGKVGSMEGKTFSPSNRTPQTRLHEYENITKKAKQQLKELQARKKYSPDASKYRLPTEEPKNENQLQAEGPRSAKSNDYIKSLSSNYSQKYFRKQNTAKEAKAETRQAKEAKIRSSHREETKAYEKGSPENKIETKLQSPKKKQFLDSNEYKKLHEKLDSIENKITDMKKNLQKKKEEKQRMLEGKQKRTEGEKEVEKFGLKGLVTQMPEQGELHTFNSNPYSPRHNTYYVSELTRAYTDERSLAREHLLTSLNILKMLEKSKRMTDEDLKKAKLRLPRRKGCEDAKTIIFDLDETLIHCNDSVSPPYDVKLPIKFPTGEIIEAGINIRPYAREILKNLSKYFEIIVFTASHSCYANVVIDYLDPTQEWVHHRLFREHCSHSAEGMYIKDLRVIDRDLKDMVLVDNAAYSYAYQLDNGIPILPYYHGSVDFELKMLEEYLLKLLYSKDVRETNEKTFKLSQYKYYYGKPEKLVEELYLNK